MGYKESRIYERLIEKIGFEPEFPSGFNELGLESKPEGYIGFIYADGNRMGEHMAKQIDTFSDLEKFSTDVDEATLKATVTAITKHFEKEYLFSWDNIPGNDNERLIEFLKQKYSIDWVQTAKIEKINNNKTIRLFTGKNHLSLTLNNEKTEIYLRIDVGRTYKFAVKTENNKLNIYDKYFPFQIILAGGDDMILALPANKAVDVAVDFCKDFGDRLKERGITTSASIVICHDGLPIKNVINIAESLIKNAKTESRKNGGECYLDFTVVTGSSLDDPIVKREKELKYRNSGIHYITKRPYSIPEMEKLIEVINELKEAKFPKNKLNALYNSLFKSHFQSILDACYLRTRLQGANKDAMNKLIDQFQLTKFPWEEKEINKYMTPFGDIVELYEFIE